MEKATALVLRGTDWSETSRILTLFTREFGKVRGLAKGARRPRSNFEIAFDLLNVCDIVFIHKQHGGLDLLTEARIAERFPRLRTDLRALNAGYYLAELLADGTQDFDPHPILLDSALSTLRALGDAHTKARVSAFELVWLRELGYMPRLESCTVCESDLSGPLLDGVLYGIAASSGGLICPKCPSAVRDRGIVRSETVTTLRSLARGVDTSPPIITAEVRRVLGELVVGVLGRRPRLLSYVDA